MFDSNVLNSSPLMNVTTTRSSWTGYRAPNWFCLHHATGPSRPARLGIGHSFLPGTRRRQAIAANALGITSASDVKTVRVRTGPRARGFFERAGFRWVRALPQNLIELHLALAPA
jgi:hypothetical protein